MDLYDFSFLEVFLVFTTGRYRAVVAGQKTERIEEVTPAGRRLSCYLRVRGILVVLEVTVGVIAVIFGAFDVVEGVREILGLGFRKCSKEHSKDVISRGIAEKG